MTPQFTPQEIISLMEAYLTSKPREEVPDKVYQNLLEKGLVSLSLSTGNVLTTPKGSVLAHFICTLPLPIPDWRMVIPQDYPFGITAPQQKGLV